MPRSSKSFLFPDVNVWVALTYERHVHHVAARQWFHNLESEARVCFCRFTQLSLLRLLTTEAVMGDEVLSQAGAWDAYDGWIENGKVVLLEEPSAIERTFRSLTQELRPSPKNWADSYLAAFATVSGLRLVTFDQAFRDMTGNFLILKA